MKATNLQDEVSSGIIKTEIGDHFSIFADMKITRTEYNNIDKNYQETLNQRK